LLLSLPSSSFLSFPLLSFLSPPFLPLIIHTGDLILIYF
jgi:hypothetical protein